MPSPAQTDCAQLPGITHHPIGRRSGCNSGENHHYFAARWVQRNIVMYRLQHGCVNLRRNHTSDSAPTTPSTRSNISVAGVAFNDFYYVVRLQWTLSSDAEQTAISIAAIFQKLMSFPAACKEFRLNLPVAVYPANLQPLIRRPARGIARGVTNHLAMAG